MNLKPTPTNRCVKTFNGQIVPASGQVTASIKIGNKQINAPFLVVDGSEDSVIVGSNIINYNKASSGYGGAIDFENIPTSAFFDTISDGHAAAAKDHHEQLYRLKYRDIGTQRDIRNDSWRVRFFSSKRQMLPANTASYVRVTSDYCGASVDVCPDPATGHRDFPALMTTAPQFVRSDSSLITFENWSNSTAVFEEGQLIAEGMPTIHDHDMSKTAVSQFQLVLLFSLIHRCDFTKTTYI